MLVNKNDVSHTERRVRLTNQIALLLIVCATPYYRIFGLISDNLAYPIVGIVFFLILALVLNRFRRHVLAKWVVVLVANMTLLFYSSSLGQAVQIQMVYFALMGFPFVIFDMSQKRQLFCAAMLPVVNLIVLEVTAYRVFPRYEITVSGMSEWIYYTILLVTTCIVFLTQKFYVDANFRYEKALSDTNEILAKNVAELHVQQTLLKRRITAIHEMTADCADLPEWERVCRNIFQYQLNLTPQAWVAKGDAGGDVLVGSHMRGELPSILHTKDDVGRHLLHDIDCFSWIADGVTVLLPVVSGATLPAVIGLSPAEPLSTEDLEFAVMVVGALQKSLQFIRSAETLKTLNMSTFVADNEALFREFRITDRELEIIGMLVQGMSNAQISARLVVTESTTKRHVYNIFQKLGIKSRFELVGWVGDRAVEG